MLSLSDAPLSDSLMKAANEIGNANNRIIRFEEFICSMDIERYNKSFERLEDVEVRCAKNETVCCQKTHILKTNILKTIFLKKRKNEHKTQKGHKKRRTSITQCIEVLGGVSDDVDGIKSDFAAEKEKRNKVDNEVKKTLEEHKPKLTIWKVN